MRFNKAELETLASNPSTEFEKQGLLIITERRFMRSSEVNYPRWCKLFGNLIFCLKNQDKCSQVFGLLVLENCRPLIRNENREPEGFAFFLEFDNVLSVKIYTQTVKDRLEWVKCIQLASYVYMNRQIEYLQQQINRKMGNQIETGAKHEDLVEPATDAIVNAESNHMLEEDLLELPICESTLSCDKLPCDYQGRAPNARVICSVLDTKVNCLWHDFARTEIVESSIKPLFLCTIRFLPSAGFTSDALLRFTVYDIREKLTSTAVPIGYAEVRLGVIQDATRFRLPLQCCRSSESYMTIASCSYEQNNKINTRSITQVFEYQKKGHRRSQSLPPKLGRKLFVPFQHYIQNVFANPKVHTYRFRSTVGRDISVHEIMLESKLCFSIPQQLLNIWIQREKELLQELSGMGELGGEWRKRQLDLLDKHLKLLTDYSQAKQTLQQFAKDSKTYFKRSSVKSDETLEFLPINLHLQRMCANNDTLSRPRVLDIITVGAFARHTVKSSTGGLISLLQESKESPLKAINGNLCKVRAADDAVQAIQELRKDVVKIMSELLSLAKNQNTKGMIPLCQELITKTKTLLNICEPMLVEEAFAFIEKHRIIEEPDNIIMPISPFRKITQQLGALDLKSPDLEDFATPILEPPDVWSNMKTAAFRKSKTLVRSKSFNLDSAASNIDIKAIIELQRNIKRYNNQLHKNVEAELNEEELTFQSLPIDWTQNSDVTEVEPSVNFNPLAGFLDAKAMHSCPSANFYRPTEEPEPCDLTQLNIEASVMCLVSKIKFLCGRSGSPAIRLRHPNHVMKREGFSNSLLKSEPDVLINSSKQKSMETTPTSLQLNLTSNTVKKGNKFTDGLDLSSTTDWPSELRPSMRKLRHAMDGLLKTARLIHSVQRLQQDTKQISQELEIMYTRDVCFSQALTALVTGLMAKFWGTEITENCMRVVTELGPLVYFEGLLSLYGKETDFWGDMCIAIEDLCAVNFMFSTAGTYQSGVLPIPHVTGSRHSLQVTLPVPEEVYNLLHNKTDQTFKVTPVFFNIGINEKATLAETLGMTRKQTRSNWDNFVRLKQYYTRYHKLNVLKPEESAAAVNLLDFLEHQLKMDVSKNIKVLHVAEDTCRLMQGLRFTSCKSAKDRTGMAVTLEQCRVLVQELNLLTSTVPLVLRTMRSEGTRMDNVYKNIGIHKYAFNLPQVLSLPAVYRPVIGTYGKAET